MATEDEMMADLASADAAGDTQLAQHIAGQIKAARTPPPGKMEAFGRGVTKGVGDRIIAGLGAAEQQNAIPTPGSLHATNVATGQPVDEPRLVAERARLLEERRARGREVETAQPRAYFAGEMVPAVASMAIPGGAGVKGAAAITGGLTAAGSEADSPLRLGAEGLAGAALGGAGAKLLSLLARGAGSVGEAVLPRAQALRDRITAKIGDRAAAVAEATARSAAGSAGAVAREGSSALRDLVQGVANPALSEAEQAANRASLAQPEASALATDLAQKTREKLPGLLEHIQAAKALAAETAGDAAAARSPESIAAMEKQMRSETARRLLMRYVLPS